MRIDEMNLTLNVMMMVPAWSVLLVLATVVRADETTATTATTNISPAAAGTAMPVHVPKKSNRYLAHIFNKYGSHGAIGFEGFEHLMHSLHLGGVEFGPTHTVDEHRPKDFKLPDIALNLTDHAHETTDEATTTTVHWSSASASLSSSTIRPANASQVITDETRNATRNATGGQLGDVDMWNDEMWLDASFKQMHDPKHRHPRHHDRSLDACLSPVALLHMTINHKRHTDTLRHQLQHHQQPQQRRRRHSDHHHGSAAHAFDDDDVDDDAADDSSDDDNNHQGDELLFDAQQLADVQITPDMFLEMCPLLLLQLDQRACATGVSSSRVPDIGAPSGWQGSGMSWLYATVSILIISMCGLVGVAIVPLTKSGGYQQLLRFLVAVAVGTLCGDALMHLLPHALVPHGHNDDATVAPVTLFTNGDRAFEPVWLCFCAFVSALAMYTLETALPLLGARDGHAHGHGHGHSHSMVNVKSSSSSSAAAATSPPGAAAAATNDDASNMLDEPLARKRTASAPLSPVAFMVLLGDGLHNITDGMAIGAAFAVDPVTGMATALAVLCHELPHELGDFALLLQTGVSVRRALVFNVGSSVLSVLGMAGGLLVAGVSVTMVRWIYAGTAGTFLYIALADLVPEMRKGGDGNEDGRQSGKDVAVQVVGILAGGLLMLVIAMYEEKLKMLFD